MPRLSDQDRENAFREYVRLKSGGLSDAKIARHFGVAQMTIVRWKRRYPEAFKADPARADGDIRMSSPTFDVAPPLLAGGGGTDPDQLRRELRWLRELASNLLLENERLKAMQAGRLSAAE